MYRYEEPEVPDSNFEARTRIRGIEETGLEARRKSATDSERPTTVELPQAQRKDPMVSVPAVPGRTTFRQRDEQAAEAVREEPRSADKVAAAAGFPSSPHWTPAIS
jgi:hypothetical protein